MAGSHRPAAPRKVADPACAYLPSGGSLEGIFIPGWVAAYAGPAVVLTVSFAWNARLNGLWAWPNLYFGLPLTSLSAGLVVLRAIEKLQALAAQPLLFRLLLAPSTFASIMMALIVWLLLFFIQTAIRKRFQHARPAVQRTYLAGWSNLLGIVAYIMFRSVL
jgi:hypothetical protein